MAHFDRERLSDIVARAAQLPFIQGLIVTYDGKPVVERVFDGPGLDHPVGIESISKGLITTLVGIAIGKGMIESVDQPILPLLKKRAPPNLNPGVASITIDHLLSMRAGLERTCGRNEQLWVQSPDWVAYTLSQPFLDAPGRGMIYSTGNTHLLSAILTDVSGKSTWELAKLWLGEPLGVTVPQWPRDPQGIYVGGMQMLLSARGLSRFADMYRTGGLYAGHQLVPRNWVQTSWTAHSVPNLPVLGRAYGYGWYMTEVYGHLVYAVWGVGGQVLCVIPTLKLTVVMTSAVPTRGSGTARGQIMELQQLVFNGLMPAFIEMQAATAG